MKHFYLCSLLAAAVLGLTACSCSQNNASAEPAVVEETLPAAADAGHTTETDETKTKENSNMQMTIANTPVTVDWENNASVDALRDLAKKEKLSIQMSMYGGFEQVGPIGTTLPSNDSELTTSAGDIVLYSGDQIVVFYGSNSWAYTKLGHISDRTPQELAGLLGNGDVAITIEAD